ncbi:MAG: cation diffusion facilitator family transporter [Candidatus Lokiarchaeota archaeon]|nr:cation diffusion facilitator family transporter [Candidatus Harpocratesius repetitus]
MNRQLHSEQHGHLNGDSCKHSHEHSHEHSHKNSHGHSHRHSHTQDSVDSLGLPFFLNLFFTLFEFVGGWFTNSIAIITDAFHDFGDSLSLGLLYGLAKYSKKSPDRKYTYGYQRFQTLGTIFTAISLIAGSIYSITEGIKRIFAPEEVLPTGIFIMAIVGVAVNFFSMWRLRKRNGYSEKIVTLHLLEDMIGWIAVLITGGIMMFIYIPLLDTILSFILAAFILYQAAGYLIEIFRIILMKNPFDEESTEIIAKLKTIPLVSDIHDFHIWSLDGENHIITLHAVTTLCNPEEITTLRETIRNKLAPYSQHCTIEIEQEGYRCVFADSCYNACEDEEPTKSEMKVKD